MIRDSHTAIRYRASARATDAAEPPLSDFSGHDEWLLDEALAETFPASDAIAVSPPASDVEDGGARRQGPRRH